MKTRDQKIRAIVKCFKKWGYDNHLSEHLAKPSRRNIAEILRMDAEEILRVIGVDDCCK